MEVTSIKEWDKAIEIICRDEYIPDDFQCGEYCRRQIILSGRKSDTNYELASESKVREEERE